MNILLESLKELTEASEQQWTADNYDRWPWKLRDEWHGSEECNEFYKEEDKLRQEYYANIDKIRIFYTLADYVAKLEGKLSEAPKAPKSVPFNEKRLTGLNLDKETLKTLKEIHTEVNAKAEDVINTIETAYSGFQPKIKELETLRTKIEGLAKAVENGKDREYYEKQAEDVRKKYITKFLERTQKTEYTTGTNDDPIKYTVKWTESLKEDVASTIPAQPLPHDELFAAIDAVKPGSYVNVGYLNEVTKTYLQAKFIGGRGSEGNPLVRLFKVTEIYGRCGIDHESQQAIKDLRASGVERKGNIYEIESELGNKIFKVPGTGNELLQIYPRSKSDVKVRYFISLDDEDLRPATREEIELYCKPSAITPRGEFNPADPMRLNLAKIYWFKNLGQSILR